MTCISDTSTHRFSEGSLEMGGPSITCDCGQTQAWLTVSGLKTSVKLGTETAEGFIPWEPTP